MLRWRERIKERRSGLIADFNIRTKKLLERQVGHILMTMNGTRGKTQGSFQPAVG